MQQPLVGEPAADRILDREPVRPWIFAASISASTTVRSVEVVRKIRSDMIVVERGAGGLPALAALERRIDLELDRLEDGDGDLGEPAGGAPALLSAG